MADKPGRRTVAVAARKPLPKWTQPFLAELAATSNVAASARRAKVATATAYELRRADPEFNRKWQAALCEGYDHLEMELLHRLRTGEIRPPAGAKRGVRQFDNATAFRQLSVHRESAARQRAIRDNADTEAILASIDAKLDRMRQRALQAAARASETQSPDESRNDEE